MDQLTTKMTGDGSLTFFSESFQECFHSRYGAKQESIYQYVVPAKLLELASTKSEIHVLDVCYGLGYNTAACLEVLRPVAVPITVHALEINPQVPRLALDEGIMNLWSDDIQNILKFVAKDLSYTNKNRSVFLHIGDARQTIKNLPLAWADAIFLDPFSPPKCPQLWTVEFIQLLADRLHPQGCILTYSCSAAVRKAMTLAGLVVGSTPPLGRFAPGTIAAFDPSKIPPLTTAETEHLQTKAAVPYRDPDLQNDPQSILARRKTEQQESNLEPTSQWKRRHTRVNGESL
jgi:tRNA U34 5-methylaminomethyl-2-thiouridine-forming methyltransferase MnmC